MLSLVGVTLTDTSSLLPEPPRKTTLLVAASPLPLIVTEPPVRTRAWDWQPLLQRTELIFGCGT